MHVPRTSSCAATSSHWLKCSSNVASSFLGTESCWSLFSTAVRCLPRAEPHSSAPRHRLDNTKLADFEYHPAPPGEAPYGSRQARHMFRVKVPASMRSASHLVWMEATSTALRGLRPRISSFVRARCTCAIGSSATCVHLAMLMMIVHNLPRPDVNGMRAEGIPVTSQLCAWNRPGAGATYDVTKPMSRLPFLRESHTDMHAGDDNARRAVQCSSSDGYRARYNPIADKDIESPGSNSGGFAICQYAQTKSSVSHSFLLLSCGLQIEHDAMFLDGCSRHRNQPTQIRLLKLLHSSCL